MGSIFDTIFNKYFQNRQAYCLMFGLDAVGKTTILWKLKFDEQVPTIPTIGFGVETFEYKGFNMSIWDAGGQDRQRTLWRQYNHNVQGLIYVIDSNDTQRFNKASEVLQNLLAEDELRDCVLLVYANKQDLPNSLKPQELCDRLNLNRIVNIPWHIQGACAKTGDGLYDGLDWLVDQIAKKFK